MTMMSLGSLSSFVELAKKENNNEPKLIVVFCNSTKNDNKPRLIIIFMEFAEKEDDDEPSSLSSSKCINKKQQRHNKLNSSSYSKTHQVHTPKDNDKLAFVIIFYNITKF